jgi:hypothetical protein
MPSPNEINVVAELDDAYTPPPPKNHEGKHYEH